MAAGSPPLEILVTRQFGVFCLFVCVLFCFERYVCCPPRTPPNVCGQGGVQDTYFQAAHQPNWHTWHTTCLLCRTAAVLVRLAEGHGQVICKVGWCDQDRSLACAVASVHQPSLLSITQYIWYLSGRLANMIARWFWSVKTCLHVISFLLSIHPGPTLYFCRRYLYKIIYFLTGLSP